MKRVTNHSQPLHLRLTSRSTADRFVAKRDRTSVVALSIRGGIALDPSFQRGAEA